MISLRSLENLSLFKKDLYLWIFRSLLESELDKLTLIFGRLLSLRSITSLQNNVPLVMLEINSLGLKDNSLSPTLTVTLLSGLLISKQILWLARLATFALNGVFWMSSRKVKDFGNFSDVLGFI
jgi:hypothetical protein